MLPQNADNEPASALLERIQGRGDIKADRK
jgi:hypothetical protein